MNKDLEKFVKKNFKKPGKALDLGAGDFEDVEGLKKLGWDAEGVDLKTGVDLEQKYLSPNHPFDLVVCAHVLHFIKNKQTLIESICNNLDLGGLCYFEDLEKSELTTDMYLTKEEMIKSFPEDCFEILSVRKFKYFDDKPGHKHWHDIVEITAKRIIS